MKKDDFGDRMKIYEMAEAGRKLMPLLPVVARLDGRSFSKFTDGLERPYDRRLSELMVTTADYVARQTQACMAYTQSDEITLTWASFAYDEQMLFDGRISKLNSVLASLATAYFNIRLQEFLPEKWKKSIPVFDCRVWNVPNLTEGANVFLWREKDATKNSISMAARHYYRHNELHQKSGSEMQEMLFQKGVNWNDYPAFFKRGTFIQRRKVLRKLSIDEAAKMKLPPKHHFWTNPDLEQEVTEYTTLAMPAFTKVFNRLEVIYFGHEPMWLKLGPNAVKPEEIG